MTITIEVEKNYYDGSCPRSVTRLSKVDLLMKDDWGLTPLTAADPGELFKIINDRAQARSVIVAGHLPIADWHATMADSTVVDAILDHASSGVM